MRKSKYGNLEQTYLEKSLENYYDTIIPITENFIVKLKSGREYIIDRDGNVNIKEGLLAYDITNSNDKSKFYGKTVSGYNLSGKYTNAIPAWKIFLVDSDNIYLIASDYISYENTGKKEIIKENETANIGYGYYSNMYKMNFTPFIENNIYKGSYDILNNNKLNATISKYHKYVKTYQSSATDGIKAVASMLDTELWSGYCNKEYAEYAIGGPTLEMFCDSYNATHDIDILHIVINNKGYAIKLNKEGTDFTTGGIYINTDNTLYTINSKGKTNTYWLASPYPRTGSDKWLLFVDSNGQMSGWNYANNNCGFRPIVCLKSTITLKEMNDNFEIIR